MHSSTVTQKGQITIPSEIRQLLGLHTGDKVGFVIENDHVVLIRRHDSVEAAFGLCHPEKSASSDDMKKAVLERGKKDESS